jgi:hypothetical protein
MYRRSAVGKLPPSPCTTDLKFLEFTALEAIQHAAAIHAGCRGRERQQVGPLGMMPAGEGRHRQAAPKDNMTAPALRSRYFRLVPPRVADFDQKHEISRDK